MVSVPYTIEQAKIDIAALRGQVDQLTEILKISDSAADWTNASDGSWLYSLSGGLKYVSSDGNNYKAGLIRAKTTGTQVVNSSSPATLTGTTISLGTGAYAYEGWCWFHPDTATYAPYVFAAGSLSVSSFNGLIQYSWNSGAVVWDQPTFNVNTGLNGPTLATGRDYLGYIKGALTVSGAGTIQIGVATSGGDGFTTYAGCMLEVQPDD